jgi:DNA polymerase I-like protein with 3'-5' exonuclease and polymerase domains
MIRLNDRLRREKLGRVLFTVHDSIESEVYASRKFEAMQVIYDEMITIPEILQTKLPPGFELEVDVEYGPSWGESEIFHPERVR